MLVKINQFNILNHINIPIFIHDWFAPMEKTYSEQIYIIENLLDKE